MALLLDEVTTPTTGSTFTLTTPCSLYVRGLAGGKLKIEISPNDSPEAWGTLIEGRSFDAGFVVDPIGSYKLRAVLVDVKPDTVCTVQTVS